jgi:hypothetical protein
MSDNRDVDYIGRREHDAALDFIGALNLPGLVSEDIYAASLGDGAGGLVVGDAELESRLARDALLDEIARYDLSADATADEYIAKYEAAAKRCDVDLRKRH